MNRGFWQREHDYRRRLFYLTPVAAILMTLLFLTFDRLPYRQLERQVGWKGEMHILPEITIIPDTKDAVSVDRQKRLETMTSLDIDLVDAPDLPTASKHDVTREREEEKLDVEVNDLDARTMRASRDVPYSQDYVILKMVEPVYPNEELLAGVEGSVVVELFVNEYGRVERATVLSALGPESFQESALAAVQQFVFQAPVEDGKASSMWIKFLIKFRIFG